MATVQLAPNILLQNLCADSLAIGGEKRLRSFNSSFNSVDTDDLPIDLEGSLAKILADPPKKTVMDDSLAQVSIATKSRTPPRPKLVRNFTIGTAGFESVLHDIKASKRVSLHEMVSHPEKAAEKSVGAEPPRAPQLDRLTSFEVVVQQLMKERKESKANTSTIAPIVEPSLLPSAKHSMAKRWAMLRGASMVLAALHATKVSGTVLAGSAAAVNSSRRPPSPKLQEHSAGDTFNVGAWVEKSWTEQVNAGLLDDLFTTLQNNAYVDPQQLHLLQQQQQQMWMQQQQQQQQQRELAQYEYIMQNQQQQEQLDYFMQMQMQMRLQQQMQQQMQQQQMMQQMQLHPQMHLMPQLLPAHPAFPTAFVPATAMDPVALLAATAMPPAASVMPLMLVSPVAVPPMVPTGRLATIAQTQEGSRQLQEELHRMSPAQLQEALVELAPTIGALCTHTFGNYLVSSLCSLPQAQPAITAALTGRMVELSSHVQGSRVVQSALTELPIVLAVALVSELSCHVARIAKQTCGSWTICTAYKVTHANFILTEVAAAIGSLSKLQDGSRVVQRVIPEAVSRGADLSPVLDALICMGTELKVLAEDAYGNYVVQQALHHSDAPRRAHLIELLLPQLPCLALSKAGSNTAESIIGHVSVSRMAEAHRLLVVESRVDLSTHRFGRHVHSALFKRATALGMKL